MCLLEMIGADDEKLEDSAFLQSRGKCLISQVRALHPKTTLLGDSLHSSNDRKAYNASGSPSLQS